MIGLTLVAFITVTGAYSRRACRYQEWPSVDQCGSTWEENTTFLYTAFGRALWSVCIALLMRLCLEGRGLLLEAFLSWRFWTPLAQVSFEAYLIHPIVIFTWQLGGRDKQSFRLLAFFMNYVSVTVVTFAFAALVALTVEFPLAALLKYFSRARPHRRRNTEYMGHSPKMSGMSYCCNGSYGSISRQYNGIDDEELSFCRLNGNSRI